MGNGFSLQFLISYNLQLFVLTFLFKQMNHFHIQQVSRTLEAWKSHMSI